MGRIIISAPDGKKGCVEISKRVITIGRGATNDVVLPDTGVSRSHAVISSTDEGNTLVSDQNSTNGVFVNGQRIAGERRLVHQDRIQVGSYELLYEDPALGAPVHPAEIPAGSSSPMLDSSEQPQNMAADRTPQGGSVLTKLGEYEIKEKLGEGVRGSVYRARDLLGRDVAIKVLGGENPNLGESLKKEAITLARLNHGNIIKVYQFGIEQGMPFLAMEYLRGRPLSQFIQANRDLHLCEKLEIVIRASEGLKYTHAQDLIHRDIKPQHIMVLEDLDVKLIGFGIAENMAKSDGTESDIAGTLPYMSPMHFVQKRTGWCDVFSMGVVLFELLTHTLPYATERDDLPTAYQKLMSSDPAPLLGRFMSDCPAELESVVAKALSKVMIEGYGTAAEFLEALLKIQDNIKSQFLGDLLERIYTAASVKDYGGCQNVLARIRRLDAAAASKKQIEMQRADKDFQRFEHEGDHS